jgi:hypothetical protein
MAALLVFISDVHSMELQAAQGLKFVTAFYWDHDDESRAWSKRFFAKQGRMPTMAQASVYSGCTASYRGDRRGRNGRGKGGDGKDARDAGERLPCQERPFARRRPARSRHVF